jgi:hypothetical protein
VRDQVVDFVRRLVGEGRDQRSRFILIDQTVREQVTGTEIDLTQSVSKLDGDRVELELLQWSPDSQRLAARIGVSPDGRRMEWDLVEITVVPLTFRYLATLQDWSLVWTDEDIRWTAGRLEVEDRSPDKRNIIAKSPDAIGWTSHPPTAPSPRPLHEHYCDAIGPER